MAGAAIIIDDPGSPSRECRRASFSRAYGLTESEQQLTELLMRGLTLKDIADARQVSFETIRTQLKSVFAKTGTNRQADLIRILS
jgi:DNA-binding CsgD family transcriptional regulator